MTNGVNNAAPDPQPAELAEQQGVSLPPLPRTNYNACGDGSQPLYTAEQMEDYARAALDARQTVEESEDYAVPPLATERMLDAGWPYGEVINSRFDRQGAYADLLAAATSARQSRVGGTLQDHLLDKRNRLMTSYGNGDREDAAIDAQIAQVDAELALIDQRDAAPGVGNG